MKRISILFIVFISCGIHAQEKVISKTATYTYDDRIEDLYDKAYEHLYSHKDSAYFYFGKIEKLAIAKKDWSNVFEALISMNRTAGNFYDLRFLGENIAKLDSLMIVDNRIDELPEKSLFVQSLLYDKGNYFFNLKDYAKARKPFLKLISQFEKSPDSLLDVEEFDLLAVSYSFIAKMYADEGKHQLAKEFYQKNIRLLHSSRPEDKDALFGNYALLAEVYREEEKYRLSNHYFRDVLFFDLKNGINTNRISSVARNLTENYIALSELDSARQYLNLGSKYVPDGHPFSPLMHRSVAKISLKLGDTLVALAELSRALSLLDDQATQKNYSTAAVFNEMAEVHAASENYQKALQNIDSGLLRLKSKKHSPLNVSLLRNKADYLLNTDKLELADKSLREAVTILDSLKPGFENKNDKLNLIEDTYPLFELGLETAYRQFSNTGNSDYIKKAFEYSEKSKSVLLLEALLASQAVDFTHIPASLLEREIQLKSQITFVEKKINASPSDTGQLEDDLFELQSEYRRLITDIERDHKTYYDLKYNTAVISFDDVRKNLEEDELLISFFYGREWIYGIGIGKTTEKFEKIAAGALLEKQIKNIRQMLSTPKSNSDYLADASHQLHKKLIEPFIDSEEITELTLITDGLLNYIAFGALNTSPSDIDYLAEHYAISYANSATLNQQLRQREKNSSEVLAFAPSFDGTAEVDTDRSKLLPLPHNKREVEQILTNFEGQSFVDAEASLQNFRNELSEFGILHLATHAIFNDTLPEYSFLAFTQEEDVANDNVLFTADLYNLKINADLVTLSACESGLGELRKGEGFLSLARGFFYSGASCLASTLWKVNDASSASLMASFYENLAHGDTKNVALQKAQMTFLNLNRQNALSHPYYWSGYTITGNIDPVINRLNLWWVFLPMAFLVAVGVFYFRRKRSA